MYDVGLASTQHWFNVSRFLGNLNHAIDAIYVLAFRQLIRQYVFTPL